MYNVFRLMEGSGSVRASCARGARYIEQGLEWDWLVGWLVGC